MRRLVTTAIGTIGRPEIRPSVTMPRPGNPRDLRHVGGHRHRRAHLQFLAQGNERPRAAFFAHPVAFGAGPAHRQDAEPPERYGLQVGVAMARNHRAHFVHHRRAGEGHHDVLPMPHRHDGGMVHAQAGVEIGRLDDKAI